MNAKRLSVFLLVLSVLASLPAGRALAKEIVGVTISGPELPGEVELTDVKARVVASAPWFDLQPSAQPADLPDEGHYEIRMAIGEGEQVVATNVFHYYPGAVERPGYFFYAECLGCSSGSEGEWYRLRDQEDLALRELLVGLGAPAALMEAPEASAAQSAVADFSVPAGSQGQDSIPGQGNVPIIVALSVALLALAAFGLLRRRAHRPAVDA